MKTFKISFLLLIHCLAAPFFISQLYAEIEIVQVFPDLTFNSPIEIISPPDESGRLFIVSQQGVIHLLQSTDDNTESSQFLDIRSNVLFGGEQGLLGLAFHPQFTDNGYFYVNYTAPNPRRTIISRFSVSPDNNDVADQESELILLEYNQPYTNHNGGKIEFGPDGYLYISSGDGGSGGDPDNNSQNLSSLLGKILRIDVDNSDGGKNYAIPQDNPFKDNTVNYAEEIYAYGLRNVWKFSFDASGLLWAADVGQNAWEEISLIENGGNYGWRIMEGNHCYNPRTNCDQTGLELPVWEYAHNSEGGYSITGGYVYEGSEAPKLQGKYIYGDFVTGNIWAFDLSTNINEFLAKFNGDISTFGVDNDNKLYLASYSTGMIYKIIDDKISSAENNIISKFELAQNYPNPFNPTTTIEYSLPTDMRYEYQDVRLVVYDILGREIVTLVNRKQNPGNYKIEWDAGNQTSGIYFYKLTYGKFTRTNKMLLIK